MGVKISNPVVGTAQPGDVRSTKTFSALDLAPGQAGTLPTQTGGRTITPGTANQTLDAGIYDSANTVAGDANLVAGNIASGVSIFGVTGSSQVAAGTATPSNVLSGVTFTSGSATGTQTGTIPQVAAKTVTPNTATQTALAAGNYAQGAISVAGDANLIAANILSGKSIFGVAGNVTPKQFASGTATSAASTQSGWINGTGGGGQNGVPLTISGLSFTPSVIVAVKSGSPSSYDIIVYEGSVPISTGAQSYVTENYFSNNGVLFSVDGTLCKIGTTSQLPCANTNTVYDWYAWA